MRSAEFLAAFAAGPVVRLAIVQGTVRAGFPSPADDFAVKRQDLNELVITHPAATFFWQCRGLSMIEAGIADGDLLVVNRALTPQHGDIVIAEVDGAFTVKRLYKRQGRVKLIASNPTFPDIIPQEGQTLIVCGVVTWNFRKLR